MIPPPLRDALRIEMLCDVAPHEAEESVAEELEAAAAAAATGEKDCGIADIDAGSACSDYSDHNRGNTDGDGEEVDAFAHDAVLLAFKVSTSLRNDPACFSSRRKDLHCMYIPFGLHAPHSHPSQASVAAAACLQPWQVRTAGTCSHMPLTLMFRSNGCSCSCQMMLSALVSCSDDERSARFSECIIILFTSPRLQRSGRL
jgi:hypothetical protein